MAVTERNGSWSVFVYRSDLRRKVYVGRRRTEFEARALEREKRAEFATVEKPAGNSAAGAAVEHVAVAELLRRGFRVAKPVVDNDGVDLVVDYRVRVQVKSSAYAVGSKYVAKRPRPGERTTYLQVTTGRGRGREAYDVDVLLVFDDRPSQQVFYVIPATEVAGGVTQITPKYQVWRDAWHVLRELPGVSTCSCSVAA